MPRLHLFQGYGVELEYMIVNRDTLAISPIADELLKHELGAYESDFENGTVTWSNELVLHVIELKSTQPESDFDALEVAFTENIRKVNSILSKWNATLMPTAAHPFMSPITEAKLWPHDNNEVYTVYNRIFDCRGHGWSNLQSTHLNLPFFDGAEFTRLHAAIRLVLPILPALCASSPIIDEKLTGSLDTRLKYYQENQKRVPSIVGMVIPEAIFSQEEYENLIYKKIKTDITPFDTEQILDPIWVNSRGAIPRFDRGSIEIRLMDVQECPAADLSIIKLVIGVIKALAEGKFVVQESQMKWQPQPLALILNDCITEAERAIIKNTDYLRVFGINDNSMEAGDLWRHLYTTLAKENDLMRIKTSIDVIFTQGSLSTRIVKSLNRDLSTTSLTGVYTELVNCLAENRMFLI